MCAALSPSGGLFVPHSLHHLEVPLLDSAMVTEHHQKASPKPSSLLSSFGEVELQREYMPLAVPLMVGNVLFPRLLPFGL